MKARIFKSPKSSTQSGMANAKAWIIEYEPESPTAVEPLMGWTASDDMRRQLTLEFTTRDEAIAYAERNKISYEVEPENLTAAPATKAYADNFKVNRKQMWTH